jgi:LmbE family N-acetylglucosaminyl deacetylase
MKRNILAIGAHPDDVEFGCSGTLLKHSKCGDNVTVLVMTNGVSTDGVTGKTIRSEEEFVGETTIAAERMHANLRLLDFQDLHVPFSFESVSGIEKVIRELDVDVLYTHWAGDSNQDHIATYKASIAAARYVKNVYCYEQIPIPRHTENEMKCTLYNDITDVFEEKMHVVESHFSQLKKYAVAGFDVKKNLEVLARYRGIQAGVKYAEAFQVIKTVS